MERVLSPLARTSRAARCFSTTTRNAAPGPSRKPRQADDFAPSLDIRELDVYKFDDPTSLGWLRLEKIREVQELFRKLEVDRPVLQAQAKQFKPPTSKQSIRIRSSIDLSYPTSPTQRKSVLIAPIASLPLKGADATQRMKVIAGPRWTPGYPGRNEFETSPEQGEKSDINKDGWIKISEERFPDARTNRWNVGNMLERLVEAANDPKSALSASTPIDIRHLLARQAKKRSTASGGAWRKTDALSRRSEVIGGVRGFPAEWVSQGEPASSEASAKA